MSVVKLVLLRISKNIFDKENTGFGEYGDNVAELYHVLCFIITFIVTFFIGFV